MANKNRFLLHAKTSVRLKVAVGAVLASTGCSMMNPYVPLPPGPTTREDDGLRLAGQANEALAAADMLRRGYYESLRSNAVVRNTTGVVAGVLTGWALYNAFQPDGGNRSDATTRRSLRLGVTLATLYGFRELFVNPDHESTYAEGYRAMTCLMLQSAPLLLTESVVPPSSSTILPIGDTPSPQVILPPYSQPAFGDMDRLHTALDQLERRILQVNLRVAQMRASADAKANDNQDLLDAQKAVRKQLDATDKVLGYARNALSDGRTLARTIQSAGQTIHHRAAIIAGVVNQQLQQKQSNFKQSSDTVKDAQDIASGIMDLGAATAADQVTLMGAAQASMHAPAILLAGPMSVIGDLLARPPSDSAPRIDLLAAAAPAASASGARKPTQKAAPVAKPAPASLNLDELKAHRDALDSTIKSVQERLAAEQKLADEKALQKRMDAFEQRVKQLLPPDEPGMLALAALTEQLYAARRPVVQELQNFRRRTREVMATAECMELAPLRVTPTEVQRVYAGDTVSYLISQRVPGDNPMAVLQGPDHEQTGIIFKWEPLGGTNQYRASLKVGPEMKTQTVKLVVTDSRGVASQTLTIVAGSSANSIAKFAQPAASAAKTPASAATRTGS